METLGDSAIALRKDSAAEAKSLGLVSRVVPDGQALEQGQGAAAMVDADDEDDRGDARAGDARPGHLLALGEEVEQFQLQGCFRTEAGMPAFRRMGLVALTIPDQESFSQARSRGDHSNSSLGYRFTRDKFLDFIRLKIGDC